MSLFDNITQEQATIIVSGIGTITAVVVAFLAAYLASRKDTRIRRMDRQFDFRDRREREYSEFIALMNSTVQLYFEVLSADQETLSAGGLQRLESAAQTLDTATLRLQVVVPQFVAHSVLNVNGHLQTALLSLQPIGPQYKMGEEFEAAKRNILKAFQADLNLIEDSHDRRKYMIKSRKENKRYDVQAKGTPK
ncbi:MAG: hypothetical protein ABF243_11550 [Celeribacter marinus]